MRVIVWGRNQVGKTEVFGEIVRTKKGFDIVPRKKKYRATLERVLEMKWGRYNPVTGPDAWLENLWKLLQAPYLSCGKTHK